MIYLDTQLTRVCVGLRRAELLVVLSQKMHLTLTACIKPTDSDCAGATATLNAFKYCCKHRKHAPLTLVHGICHMMN